MKAYPFDFFVCGLVINLALIIDEYLSIKYFFTSSKEIDLSIFPTNNYLLKLMKNIDFELLTVNFLILEEGNFCSNEYTQLKIN